MFSSPPAERHSDGAARPRWRGWLAGWSLLTRLLGGLIAVLAAVCAIVGVVTVTELTRFQVSQLDQRLLGVAQRAGPGPGGPFGPGPPRGRPGPGPGTPVDGQLDARIAGDRFVVAQVRTAIASEPSPLSTAQQAVLKQLPTDGRPHTRTLDGLSEYRLVARAGPGDETVIIGLPMSDVYANRSRLIATVTGVSLIALALAALLGALIIRRTLRPLRRVAATARRVTTLPLDRGEVALSIRVPESDTDARTEVGQVGAALNRMLGHVGAALAARQASETRVRHFVADASHELRTPLAAIRGYAELIRRYGDVVPPDIAHAMRRVESESARMTTLVDDLLLLARLDSGRPLDAEPVDLSRLIIDAVSDARVAGPGQHWQLDLPAESVTVCADGPRLHQVLANLLSNARTHTPPGTTVHTALAVVDGETVVAVADDGPGIPADLLPEVFDRFARGDNSRSRAAGSTGLGLAIVAAVVAAHGGRVGVESRPGRTVFTVALPSPPVDGAGDR